MAAESGARASSTLTGELHARPLAILLAGACERGTSGTFTFQHGDRCDTLVMRTGRIAAVRTSQPVGYLGSILYELGAIDMTALNATLREVASARRLHGDVLVEQGLVSRARVDEGLVEQTFRQVHHLFSLPGETRWTFREDVDQLAGARDEDRPAVDAWPAIWRGLRDQPPCLHVRRTLARIEGAIHLPDLGVLRRFALAPGEMELCNRLHTKPVTWARLAESSPLSSERTQLLVYLLAVSRSIVRIDEPVTSPAALGVDGVRERARTIAHEDPHTVLGLRSGASIEAARAAYFRLARVWHPGKLPAELKEVRSECGLVFSRLSEAHRLLTDVSARAHATAIVGPAAFAANDSVAPPAPAPPPTLASARISLPDIDAALARDDVDAAITLARSLSHAGAEGPAARAVLAWCLLGSGATAPEALERSLAELEKILTGDPDCARALFYRGEILKRLGRGEAALRDYKKVVRLDPRNLDAQREVRLDEARRHAQRLRPSSAPSGASRSAGDRPVATAPGTPDTVDRAPGATGLRRLLALVSRKAGT